MPRLCGPAPQHSTDPALACSSAALLNVWAELRAAGLVERYHQGRARYYRLTRAGEDWLLAVVKGEPSPLDGCGGNGTLFRSTAPKEQVSESENNAKPSLCSKQYSTTLMIRLIQWKRPCCGELSIFIRTQHWPSRCSTAG